MANELSPVPYKDPVTDESGILSQSWSKWLERVRSILRESGSGSITALIGEVTASGSGSVTATIANGVITNAKVSNTAAIAYSKLNLSLAILNADISASAAIAFSKLASLTSGNILVGNGSNVATSVALSGDVTITNAGVTAIGTNKVANSQLAQMATQTIKGRTTAGTGNAEDLTATQATAILNAMVGDSGSGGTKGLVPAPSSGDAAASKFLKANGLWAVPTASFVAPTIQKFTSSSGTYTTPANVLYIRVRAVGGGGGGSGGGAGAGTGGTGGTTTFGTSMISCVGGASGGAGATTVAGGTATLGTGPIGTACQGSPASMGTIAATAGATGGSGGSSIFGGAGGGGWASTNGAAAVANSGSGGGGGGGNGVGAFNGHGGSSGGWVDAIITSPSSTYSYAVGAAGSAGSTGTTAGGAGGSGYIEVMEFYQ